MPPKPRTTDDLPFLTASALRELVANAVDFYADHLTKIGEDKDIRRIVEPDAKFLRDTGDDLRKYIAE